MWPRLKHTHYHKFSTGDTLRRSSTLNRCNGLNTLKFQHYVWNSTSAVGLVHVSRHTVSQPGMKFLILSASAVKYRRSMGKKVAHPLQFSIDLNCNRVNASWTIRSFANPLRLKFVIHPNLPKFQVVDCFSHSFFLSHNSLICPFVLFSLYCTSVILLHCLSRKNAWLNLYYTIARYKFNIALIEPGLEQFCRVKVESYSL